MCEVNPEWRESRSTNGKEKRVGKEFTCQESMKDCKPLVTKFFPNIVATTQRPDKLDIPSSEISNPN